MQPNDGKPRSEREMDNPEFIEELRKMPPTGQTPKTPSFVEYATMFKVESRPRPAMEVDETPRQLECVNCGVLMLWTTYRLDPLTFDRRCKDCEVRAKDFYKTRPHQEVSDAKDSQSSDRTES